jgi:N-acyl-D-aspartate/D-glutamate deacylase
LTGSFDTVVSGGQVVDGTGRRAYAADVGIRDGSVAAVGDLGAIGDTATYAEPLTPPTGVRHVLVNGDVATRDGAATGARSGRFVSA